MSVNGISAPIDIAVSGLRAQALRMNVISNNIANSNTTKTDSGQPYRRQEVMLSTKGGISGVNIEQVVADTSTPFKTISDPGNPNADADGNLQTPNVELPVEMMQMVLASRAYQANASVMKRYQDTVDVTLELLK